MVSKDLLNRLIVAHNFIWRLWKELEFIAS